MSIVYYLSLFVLSLLFSVIFIYIWHKHLDVTFTVVFMLMTISCLGYVLYSQSTGLEESVAAFKVVYIGACYLQLFILLSVLNLCQIEIKRWARAGLFVICSCLYASVLTVGHLPIFYKNLSFEIVDGTAVLHREYGFMHTVFYVMLLGYMIAAIAAIVYSLRRKNQVPRRAVYLVLIPELLTLLSYFGGRQLFKNVDLIPVAYVLAEVVYILIAYRVHLYDVTDTVIDSVEQENAIGYASFDHKFRYLGSNEAARRIFPELKDCVVDKVLEKDSETKRILRGYMEDFAQTGRNEQTVQDKPTIYRIPDPDGETDKDKYYKIEINNLYVSNKKQGYLITFTDDTSNQKYIQSKKDYIKLIDQYNDDLEQQVAQKTAHIVQMHDNLIMSMAMMVESRDNSTGGHIKRTSENVRILVDEIVAAGTPDLSKDFRKAIIKAAPMHDLGKIAVDDNILRKPGRFNPEEFEKMKKHAEEGALVIHKILLNTDDELFKEVAENVAHYHHERWDGSGYPERLSGEDIPVEARIMAIADVYDALVSKRVYKDAMSFEKADAIILEGMGSQFDPGLKTIYEKARPRLEEYYRSIQEEEK